MVAQLALEAGLPPGVLNVVNGDKEAVDVLLTDKRIAAVSFVGSTPIAEYVYATGCANGKRVQALGGAKNHAVVMPDADVANAVSAMMGAAYGSCGERCMAVPLIVAVGDATADAMIAGLKTEIAKMKVGPGKDASNDMGPLVTKPHFEKVKGYVDQGVKEGAKLLVDGRGVKVPAGHEDGYFLGPCLFDDVKPGMSIYQDEIFGPVLGIVRVKTLQEAMDLIDQHEYGNGTCIFTRDGEAARYFSDNILVGMVGVNVPLPVPVAYHSFGGWKRSLFGDLHAYGPDAVRFYTKRKTITQRWPSAGVREGAVFSFPSQSLRPSQRATLAAGDQALRLHSDVPRQSRTTCSAGRSTGAARTVCAPCRGARLHCAGLLTCALGASAYRREVHSASAFAIVRSARHWATMQAVPPFRTLPAMTSIRLTTATCAAI